MIRFNINGTLAYTFGVNHPAALSGNLEYGAVYMIYNSLTDTLNVFGAPSLLGNTLKDAVILYIQEVGSTQSSQTV